MLSLLFRQSLCAAASAYGQALPIFRREPRGLFHCCKSLRAYAKPRAIPEEAVSPGALIATAIQRRIVGDQLGLNGVNLTGSQRLTLLGMLLGTTANILPDRLRLR